MNLRVLVSAPYMLPFPEKYRRRLEEENIEIVEISVVERLSESDLLGCIEDFDGAICGDDQFTEKVFRRAARLKVISKWGTGIDSIDTRAAGRSGVKICNTPNAFTDAVADTTLGYILGFARRLYQMDGEIKRGLWIKPRSLALKECAVGIVGVGNIGKAVARRARAFGMQIFGSDTVSPPETFIRETEMTLTDLPELLQKSDFVTLHCDLNPTSFHLIGEAEFSEIKSSAYLINTSRGQAVDENALAAALSSKQIAGAALDVFEIEPLPPESPLRKFENCLLAPHNSNNSPSAAEFVHESTVINLLDGLREANLLNRSEIK